MTRAGKSQFESYSNEFEQKPGDQDVFAIQTVKPLLMWQILTNHAISWVLNTEVYSEPS